MVNVCGEETVMVRLYITSSTKGSPFQRGEADQGSALRHVLLDPTVTWKVVPEAVSECIRERLNRRFSLRTVTAMSPSVAHRRAKRQRLIGRRAHITNDAAGTDTMHPKWCVMMTLDLRRRVGVRAHL